MNELVDFFEARTCLLEAWHALVRTSLDPADVQQELDGTISSLRQIHTIATGRPNLRLVNGANR